MQNDDCFVNKFTKFSNMLWMERLKDTSFLDQFARCVAASSGSEKCGEYAN